MKNLLKVCLIVFFTVQANAQTEKEIKTTMLTLQNLITHAADQFPTTEKQQIYLLVEVDEQGIDTDSRFYLEQGLRLLLKRLKPEDRIAIGTYGNHNETLVAYKDVKNVGDVMQSVIKISKLSNTTTDGIDIAYQTASMEYQKGAVNSVIMLRNDRLQGNLVTANMNTKQGQHTEPSVSQKVASSPKLGGAIALTALSILPEILEVIKN